MHAFCLVFEKVSRSMYIKYIYIEYTECLSLCLIHRDYNDIIIFCIITISLNEKQYLKFLISTFNTLNFFLLFKWI